MAKIEGLELKDTDIGAQVLYTPVVGGWESGEIASFNDSYVFVRYGEDAGSKATRGEDLVWKAAHHDNG